MDDSNSLLKMSTPVTIREFWPFGDQICEVNFFSTYLIRIKKYVIENMQSKKKQFLVCKTWTKKGFFMY